VPQEVQRVTKLMVGYCRCELAFGLQKNRPWAVFRTLLQAFTLLRMRQVQRQQLCLLLWHQPA
jgi:DNA-binding SARP family transcriptional activator